MPTGDEERRRQADEIWDFRLSALEKRVDAGFAHIDQRLDTLAYVRVETWTEREAARDAALTAIREDVEAAKSLGMWAVGLVAGLVLTALVGFLIWMAQGAPT